MSTDIWNGNQGVLTVFVSKARDLPNLTKLDKQNVLLRLRIGHMTRESDVKHRAGQNPVFDYLEEFEISPGVKPIMYVEAYCERRKKAPVPIGRCEIDLMNGIRANPKEGYSTWYELTRDRNEFAGQVFVELSFTPGLPRQSKDIVDKNIKVDVSMIQRPIPPLPTSYSKSNSQNSQTSNHNNLLHSNFNTANFDDYRRNQDIRDQSNYEHLSSSLGSTDYTHSSYMRQFTPSFEYLSSSSHAGLRLHDIDPIENSTSRLDASIGTALTDITQNSNATSVTTTSDTRFHFANLRKLKEKINIFKNPVTVDSSDNDNQVDIQALQKAIGVKPTSEKEFEDIYHHGMSNSSRSNSNMDTQSESEIEPILPPSLPKLPNNAIEDYATNLKITSPKHFSTYRVGTDLSKSTINDVNSQLVYSPKLPPLPMLAPKTVSRDRSPSPYSRRPPPKD